MRRVHLDHNATTPLRPEAREALLAALDGPYGNPSSVHASGRAARALLDEARERVAGALGVHEDEVLFTSGGTEADNLALHGAARAAGPGCKIVTTAVEHSAVLEPAGALEAAGHPVVRVGVDGCARVDPTELVEAAGGAALVSVMAANNEVGSAVDLAAVGAGLAERYGDRRPRLHSDAVQALGRLPLDLTGWGVDLATFSAHKVGGPLGVGILVRRRGTPLVPLWQGGGQEGDLRPGTENVPAIAAAAVAVELAVRERPSFVAHCSTLARQLYDGITRRIEGARLLGPPLEEPLRLANTLNLLVPEVDGRVWVTRLDLEGLEASAGSACASGALEPSHVLLAMGLSREAARAGLRLSLGRTTTAEDVHSAVDILCTTSAGARKS